MSTTTHPQEDQLPPPTEALPELTRGEHTAVTRSTRLVKGRDLVSVRFTLDRSRNRLVMEWGTPSGETGGGFCKT